MSDQQQSVLLEAEDIIHGDRRDSYGGAYESFTRIAKLWEPILGTDVTPEQVALCLIQLKVARYANGQQRDSIVDIAGYAGCLDMVRIGKEALQAEETAKKLPLNSLTGRPSIVDIPECKNCKEGISPNTVHTPDPEIDGICRINPAN